MKIFFKERIFFKFYSYKTCKKIIEDSEEKYEVNSDIKFPTKSIFTAYRLRH